MAKSKIVLFALSVLICCVSTRVFAARFPNAVEKRVVLSGHEAVVVAKMFGLSTTTTMTLPLAEEMSGAVSLLKRAVPDQSPEDAKKSPWINSVGFTAGEIPSISFGPFWLDQGTALPNSKPGVYSFRCPPMSLSDLAKSPWGGVAKQLHGVAGPAKAHPIAFWRDFGFIDGAKLKLELRSYPNDEYSVSVIVQDLPTK